MDKKEEREQERELRKRLLTKIDDLRHKINSNEPMPENVQDIDFLVEVGDRIDECLSSWYY